MDPDAPLTETEALSLPLMEEFAIDLGAVAEAVRKSGGVKLSERNVFDERGVGRIAVIRPCVSRGKRIRNLPPIYTPKMLEEAAPVFTGWPMYMDHVPQRLAEMLEEAGRSMRELGGQILRSWWDATFKHADDGKYGYRPGAVLAEVWATPYIRNLVGNNPSLLHTSINAWPKSGKPGAAPWAPHVKGMVIEGIRSEPQGSVDFVPRGGAGGRLLAEDERLLVSAAESLYNSAPVSGTRTESTTPPDFGSMTPEQLREWAQSNAPHLAESITVPEAAGGQQQQATTPPATTPAPTPAPAAAGLTEADVQRMLAEERARQERDAEQRDQQVREEAERVVAEDRENARLAGVAKALIESAEGVTNTIKADLIQRWSVLPSGPTPQLAEAEAVEGDEPKSREDVIKAKVSEDIEHARDVVAEARGKPRVKGEGGGKPADGGDGNRVTESAGDRRRKREKTPYWRTRFVEMGLAESEDRALSVFSEDLAEADAEADRAEAEKATA